MEANIRELLLFYRMLGRPLTTLEIWRLLPNDSKPKNIAHLLQTLSVLQNQNAVFEHDGFWSLENNPRVSMIRRRQDLLLDHKWKILKRLGKFYSLIPFIDFVMVSGSMAFGNIHNQSDFDVLVGVKEGRMFTTRYLTILVFSLLGARRLDDLEESSPNKLCFNHFVTKKSLTKPPFNYYRSQLYRNLIPLWGTDASIKSFIEANLWAGTNDAILSDQRHLPHRNNIIKKILEFKLNGRLGDIIENKIARAIAKRRLESYYEKHKQSGGRVVINDTELEFHFDLEYEKQLQKL
ncbi:hypothetical protein HY967_00555 [Candidatus Jorgensenbacteria bacterium]|nr:hypothetical protein [Candidatus Jorgensenbacteria bacterium]